MNKNIEMTKYYNFRKEIHKLYKNDVINSGDLCCKVLEIRDKYRCVDSINISIQTYSITVYFEHDTDDNKKLEIIDKIGKCIKKYINDNLSLISEEITKDPDFELFLLSENKIFCDIISLGDSVQFCL